MSDSIEIPTVVSELEGAGALGAAAIALLVPFFRGLPGTTVSTSTGFVWTKTALSGSEGQSVSLGGLGKLKIDSGAISVTLGVNWYGPRAEIDVLFQFNDGQALTLEVNPNVFQVADRVVIPGTSGDIIGYDRSTFAPLEIPLPSAALEFSFRPGLGDGIAASIQTYTSPDFSGSEGVYEWPFDSNKMLVFRKLFDIGIGVENIFVDLSATNGIADFKSRFPDVYKASWKGIGAKRIDLSVPVKDMFFNASADGFLVDFDGNFTGDFSLSWQNPTGELIKAIDAEISLRENDPRRGEIGVTLDLNGVKKEADTPTKNASTASSSAAETQRANDTSAEFALRKDNLDFDGQVRFSGALTYGLLGEGTDRERTVFGIDLTGAAINNGQGNAIQKFEGASALAALWTVSALVGVPLFIRGAREEDATDVATALGIFFLAIVVADETPQAAGTTFLPRLKGINFNKLKLRYIHIGVEETIGEGAAARVESYTQRLVEVGLDMGVEFEMKCRLEQLISKLLSLSLTAGGALTQLFGSTIESASLEGNLELEFGNLFLRFKHTEAHEDAAGPVEASFEIFPGIDDGLARLLEERSPVISARQIPEIKLEQSEGSSLPLPVAAIKVVRTGSGETLRRGISVSFSGLGNASMSVATPSAGVVIFWSPEFSIEPMAQLQKDPGFEFLMPPTAYARGVIDIGKPLPSIGGAQSRISVDVGLNNKEISAGKDLSADDQRKLRDFKNYEHAFGGEIVWGDATGGPNSEEFSYLFVEVHYQGKTPIFTIGPIGVYGLGGLVGHNIAPGVAKDQQNAMGIADWIFADGKGSFDTVKNWPAGAPTDQTWHPDRDWEDDKDKWAFGLFVKAGSTGDGGKSVSVDTILMIGFPEFWMALAGFAVIKPINAKITVVIVYDHPSRSFVIKAAFNYLVDRLHGRTVNMKNLLEIGTQRDPKRRWFYLGHYGNDEGGPGSARLFDFLDIKFYVVYDTEGTDKFGIVLVESDKIQPPAIPGPLFGIGALLQFGPKTYGPSWLNISVFAGLGFNVAIGNNPFIIYGDIYAIGHVQLKIAVFKGKLGFVARLYGMSVEDFYRFAGDIEIRINLPWPLSDISETFSFTIEDGVPEFPPPEISTTASALGRVEPRSLELGPTQDDLVPIDSVIALTFNKPIFEVRAGTDGNTVLTLSDPQLPDDAPEAVEVLTTEFADRTYEITLRHVLKFLRIERRPIPDPILDEPAGDVVLPPGEDPPPPPPPENWTLVNEVAAAWEPPDDVGSDGAPEPGSEPHHVLYLNTWVAPELQFSRSAQEQYYNWTLGWGTIPPCAVAEEICLLAPGADDVFVHPDVDQSRMFWTLDFTTALGRADVHELAFNTGTYGGRPRNINRLTWVDGQLDLPEYLAVGFPDADEIDLTLRIGAEIFANPPLLERMEVVFAVKLRGVGIAARIKLIARVDGGEPCGFALEVEELERDAALLSFTADVLQCEPGTTELVIHLNLIASEYISLIDRVTLEGPFFVWNEYDINHTDPGQLIKIFSSIQQTQIFRLEQVCFKRTMTSHGNWGETCLGGCEDRPEDGFGLEALWGNLLLEPGSEYRLSYGVSSFATSRVQNDDADAPNETNEEPASEQASDEAEDTVMRSYRFRTEASPSQDPERYVGLSYPSSRDGTAPPYYPDHFRPFYTLKNSGLLRRIFARHYGPGKLGSGIVDIDGNALEPDLIETLQIGSGPLDDAFEDIARQCLPDAQQMSWQEMNIWQVQLDTDQNYSIQISDLREGASRPLWSRSFRTSGFRSFAEHADHVSALFDDAHILSVVDSTTIGTLLRDLVQGALNGSTPGSDALIDAIYRQALGIDGGSLRGHLGVSDADFAGYMIGRDITGEKVWGMICELDEPLIGKAGVSLVGTIGPDTEMMASRGVFVFDDGVALRLAVTDSSGSRVILLNSADAQSFEFFPSDVTLGVNFAAGSELETLARRYLESTLRPMDQAEFDAKLAELMGTIEAHPDLATNLGNHAASISIKLPELDVIPLPGAIGDGPDDGSGGGTGGDTGRGGSGGVDPDPRPGGGGNDPRPGSDPTDPRDDPNDDDPRPRTPLNVLNVAAIGSGTTNAQPRTTTTTRPRGTNLFGRR